MVSVIVPTLDEEKVLGACLDACLSQDGEAAEILVVDGGSRDATREVATRRPGVRWLESEPGRGRQMNHGALEVSGSLLLFLAADTCLPPGAIRALGEVDRAGSPRAGGFRQRFDRRRPVLRAVSALHNLRARLTGVFYGDQAPFVSRELFHELGGFREGIDMEDVEFGSRLRRRTRPAQLGLTVTTSSRRFDRVGDLRATASAAWILACWILLRRVPRSGTYFSIVR